MHFFYWNQASFYPCESTLLVSVLINPCNGSDPTVLCHFNISSHWISSVFHSFTVASSKRQVSFVHWTQRGQKELNCTDKHTPRHVFLGERNGVFGHHRFASWRVRGHKHWVVSLQPQYGLFLENIQFKWPLEQGRAEGAESVTAQPVGKLIFTRWVNTYTEKQYIGRNTGNTHLESRVGDAFIEIITGWSYVNRNGPFLIFLWVLFWLWFVFFSFLRRRRGWHSILQREEKTSAQLMFSQKHSLGLSCIYYSITVVWKRQDCTELWLTSVGNIYQPAVIENCPRRRPWLISHAHFCTALSSVSL